MNNTTGAMNMQNTIQLNKCMYNGGKHEPITQPPIRCSVFGTFGPAICKCKNCELHLPGKCKS